MDQSCQENSFTNLDHPVSLTGWWAGRYLFRISEFLHGPLFAVKGSVPKEIKLPMNLFPREKNLWLHIKKDEKRRLYGSHLGIYLGFSSRRRDSVGNFRNKFDAWRWKIANHRAVNYSWQLQYLDYGILRGCVHASWHSKFTQQIAFEKPKVSFTPSTGIQSSVIWLTRYKTNHACSMFTAVNMCTTVRVILFWILPHLISYKGGNWCKNMVFSRLKTSPWQMPYVYKLFSSLYKKNLDY